MDAQILNRLAVLLSDHPGYAFCNDCLAKQLALKPATAWAAALELAESPDFEVDVGICSRCLDQVEDVAHVRWVHETPEAAPDAPQKPRIRFTARASEDQ